MHSPSYYYNLIKQFLQEELWRRDLTSLSLLQRTGYKLIRLLIVLLKELANGQLNLRAMSLVYTTLLSMVPLLAVSFSVLKAFGVHNQIQPLLMNLVAPLGEKGNELVINILGFVENMKVGVLGSLGLALLLYAVISLIQKMELAFNYVWHAESTRTLSRRFSDYLSVIMVGPVLVFSAIGMTASLMNTHVIQSIISIEPLGSLVIFLTKLVPFFLVIIAFCFVYMFVPNTKVKFISALVGAAVGGTLWQATGLAFAEFAASSTRYAAIYSGFAIMVLFMIWLYLSWLILLLGAQVAFFHQNPDEIRLDNQRLPLSGRFKEQLAIMVMYWIAHHFINNKKPFTAETLSDQINISGDRIGEIISLLQQRELLLESGNEPPEFLLRNDPATTKVADLIQLIRKPDSEQVRMENRIFSVNDIDNLINHIEISVAENLQGMTLKDLAIDGVQRHMDSQPKAC